MTKRPDVIAKAAKRADLSFGVSREGARHTVFDIHGLTFPIGRHNEIDDDMAVIIYKEVQSKLGKGWWKK